MGCVVLCMYSWILWVLLVRRFCEFWLLWVLMLVGLCVVLGLFCVVGGYYLLLLAVDLVRS